MKDKLFRMVSCLLIIVTLLTLTGCGKKKENNKTNNETQEKDSSLMSIATKNGKEIVSFTGDGKETTLFDLKDYDEVTYTINNNKLYLYLFNFSKSGSTSGKSSMGYIDLTDEKHTFNLITDDVEASGYPVSIAVINDNIYYTSILGNKIYKYNITSKKSEKNDFDLMLKSGATHLYNIGDDKLVDITYGSSSDVSHMSILDVKTKESKKICDDCSLESIRNGRLYYLIYESGEYGIWTYYEYDPTTDNSKIISDEAEGASSMYDSYIIPVDDYYVYVSKDTLYKYTNKSEELYKLDDYISKTVLISKDIIHIEYALSMDDDAKYATYNLNTKEFKTLDSTDYYDNVVYVK